MAEKYELHMLDVTIPVNKAREKISEMTVDRSWVKSKCLPQAMITTAAVKCGRIRNTPRTVEKKELVSLFRKLALE